MLTTESKLRVRYSETDQMSIVHHSEYVKWFEVGRTDYIRELDQTYADIEKAGFYLPVINVNVSYKSPAKYDEFIIIKSSIAEYNGVRIKFFYQAVRESDGEVLAEGSSEHCWTTTAMRPVKLSKAWPELHHILLKNMEE
ncbi:putative acyl-CoA thioesterase YneP [Pullulanibacillus camelliae]|uniref:Putative acyl-CoA thioesterase YneP n=1 Tax=Pullulanibacillus camelliae TaxID=1707096 RepID=A0A8J2YKX5_9BACL|nr:thioesterase family protein [Pullulanibacillus camelliae]GGE52015.1 putative acyl-CoA thioesterase YneP [Pullulanibacillus camelliae]